MNGRLIAGLMLGLILGLGVSLLVRQPDAKAADTTAQKWQYKAVKLERDRFGSFDLDDVNDGNYEFVTMSVTGGRDLGCIALFRRPKK